MTSAAPAPRSSGGDRRDPAQRLRLVALTPPPAPSGVWWARIADSGPESREHALVAVGSGRFAAGTPVDMTALQAGGRRPAGWLVEVGYRTVDGAVVRLVPSEDLSDRCPTLWFAELHHATSPIAASSLLAFTGGPFRAGAVVTPREVAAAGLRMADRIGEVRWYNRSGIVDDVRVAPALRRRGMGTLLVTAAEALAVLRGWAPLRSDGRLTDAGAAWLEAAPPAWRPRLADRSEVLPDPDAAVDEPVGVTRLLKDYA
ncbi:GNAT family N-acetyltransferase [Blastococcus sp. URHD0036]|uniref:GNAT family N-acetyltransferase n=1 Tax=Blastococcus sp. URHD0036 TaxID=1380356 RepID=UPI0012DDFBBB|nr:GNAT family N-acetyltransferase [Blastococcus sp. URHD0036]